MIEKIKKLNESYDYKKFCDDCGEEIPIGLSCSMATCAYCGKDLCEGCTARCMAHEDYSWSDYRGTLWCDNCWSIGEKYRPLIDEFQNKIETLYEQWQKECKEL
jgi:hypothetical protein